MTVENTSFVEPRASESRQSSKRIAELAQAKKVSPGHISDRRSVYWVDKEPALRPGNLDNIPKRICDLSRPRTTPVGHIPDRETAVSEVSDGAKKHNPSDQYMTKLAKPKNYHKEYEGNNYDFVQTSPSAMSYQTSSRISSLAQPRKKLSYEEVEEMKLSENQKQQDQKRGGTPSSGKESPSGSSGRIDVLAQPKPTFHGDGQNRSPLWPVSPGAINIEPSQRIEMLSKPKSRVELNEDYDGFKVTMAAKNAVASTRVTELCLPLPRKQSQKKAQAQKK